MKFSYVLAALPLIASVAAVPAGFNGGFNGANKGGNAAANKGGNNNANKGGAAAGAAAAAAASKSAAAAAASKSAAAAAAAKGKGSNNNAGGSAAAGNSTGNASSGNNSGDIQSSDTLDPSVIATGFEQNGQASQEAGQVASLTSSNNFINFCAGQTITNGLQIKTGSCNPAPMGQIAAQTNMPAAKFSNPKNGDTIAANTAFTISMNIKNLITGNFVNAATNYYSAPQQIDKSSGNIIGHSHFVVEQLDALDQTTPTNNVNFAFFKGVNSAAVNGVLSEAVTAGLPAGFYKLSSINSAANHQPALVAVAQHGSLDDAVYFTVSDNGAAASSNSTGSAASASNSTGSAAASGNANKGGNNAGNANKGGNNNANKGGAAAAKGGNAAAKGGAAAKSGKGRRFLREY